MINLSSAAELWQTASTLIYNIFNRPGLTDIVDVFCVAVLIYYVLRLTAKTRASSVIKGIAVIVLFTFASELFGLRAMSWLMRQVLSTGAVVLVILFQPELRRALEQIGRGRWLYTGQRARDSAEQILFAHELTDALTHLSRRKVGALIALERHTGLKEVADSGTWLDAHVTSQLLKNIFEPNTPLHDGAVVIRGSRIIAAGCILQLSDEASISKELGTRHRAAIGVSETTDAVALIVSEETGIISAAIGGKLTRHLDAASLKALLEKEYPIYEDNLIYALLKRRKSG